MLVDGLAVLPYDFYPVEELVRLETCREDYDICFYETLGGFYARGCDFLDLGVC